MALNLSVKRKASLISATGLAAAMTLIASHAVSSSIFEPFLANYAITSTYPVSDIAIFEFNSDYSSSTNPFAETAPLESAYLLGVATDLSTDTDPTQTHLVMFVSDTFAASAESIAFGTLFPNTDEDTLINALEVIGQSTPGDVDTAYSELGDFSNGDATNGPNGSIAFTFGGSFTELAFTDGQVIGTGASYATPAPPSGPPSAAPEPGAWALMLLGVGGVGATLRRSRQVAAPTLAG
jgi:hypothetical protein